MIGGKAFQSIARGPNGQALDIDGDIGPRTRWAMAFQEAPAERRLIIERAWLHLGLEEDAGPNEDCGGVIRAWLVNASVHTPAPYCAAAASCWYGMSPGVAGAQKLGRSLPETDEPGLGDAAWFPTGPWQGHIGVVLGVAEDRVMTIEANVADGVRISIRDRSRLRFGRAPGCCHNGVVPGVCSGFTFRRTALAGTR